MPKTADLDQRTPSMQRKEQFPVSSIPRSKTTKPPELLARERHEVRKLSTLVDIGKNLADSSNLKTGLARALEVLGRHHGMIRSFVMLLDSESGKIGVEAAYGLNEDAA